MTVPSVVDRSKVVTRRREDTWQKLQAGDELVLIEKGMGLKKGERQVVLARVRVVSVRVEPLVLVLTEENATAREGLPELSPPAFLTRWLAGHGYKPHETGVSCRRIEWEYLEEG